MSCLFPLIAVAKVGQKYGAPKQKVYNDANRGALKEKYGLEVKEEEGLGKVFVLNDEEDFISLLKYFAEEILEKPSAEAKTQVVNQGVPLEKYEKALSEVADLREKLAVLKKEKELCEERLKEIESEKFRTERELKEREKELSDREKELKECRKKVKLLKLQPVLEELKEKVGEEKVKEIMKLLEGEG